MSQIALDQLLSIAAPPAKPREGVQPERSTSDAFRSHLDRATETAEPKQSKTQHAEEKVDLEEEAPLESESQDQELSSSATKENTASSDKQESSEAATEQQEAEQSQDDEVTLSAAAAQAVVQQTDAVEKLPEHVLPAEQVVETSEGGGQQQPQDQPLNNLQQVTGDTEPTSTLVIPEQATGEQQIETNVITTDEITTAPNSDSEQHAHQQQPSSAETSDQRLAENATAKTSDSTDAAAAQVAQSKLTNSIASEDLTAEEQLPETESDDTHSRRAVKPQPTEKALLPAELSADSVEASEPTVETSAGPAQQASTPKASAELNLPATRAIGSAGASGSSPQSQTAEAQANELPTVDRARFVQRVGGAIRSAQQRDGQIQLRLSPPELGTLKIEIAVKEGVVTARLETDNPAARTVLLDNLPALRERLAEQQIRIEKFDVDVGRDGQQQSQQGPEDRQTHGQRSSTGRSPRTVPEPASTSTQVAPTANTQDQSGLDVRI